MPFSINITFLWTRWAFSFIQVHEYKTREPPLCYYHWLCGECLTCCSDSCPCCWHWWLPAGNPPPSGPPVPLSVFRSLPPSSFGIPSSASAALQFHSCLLWCRHTRRDEFRIPHAAVSACLLVRACVRVWGRSTCSVVCVEERAELATLYVLAEVTAQAQWIPLRERMRGSPFWAPRNRCERGINFNQRYTHSVSTPTLGLDVRNGRFVQSPEVGLRSHCRAFPVPFIGCECASVRLVLFSWSRIPAVWQDCVMCVRAVRAAVIVLTGCVCVSVAGEKKTECR